MAPCCCAEQAGMRRARAEPNHSAVDFDPNLTLQPNIRVCCHPFAMTKAHKPEGWHTVTPRIVAHDAQQLLEFVKHVFDATGEYSADRPAIITIGDSMIMISEAGARNPMPVFLYVYVEDADRTHRRAVGAGALSIEEPSDMLYGDRRGMVQDRWGNTWQIATYKGHN